MIPNKVKQLWAEGKPVLNGWLSIANPFSAEIMAEAGYDSITSDIQHGIVDYQSTITMYQAMRASGVTPMARVPWLDPGDIMKALDGGAYGIVCPMINTAEEAARLVSYVRYPPLGNRSFGPSRVSISAGANYASEANDQIICLAMIETAEGVANLDQIVRTPGLDGVYIGPADLTLGVTNGRLPPGFDRQEPEMIEVIQKILSTAHDAGIKAALHCGSASYAAQAIGWGFDLVTVLNDARLLATASKSVVDETRALVAGQESSAAETSASGY